MDRRRSRSFLSAVLAFAALAVVPVADAAPKDAAAQKLQNDAMNNDYLGTNFAAAESKLQKAAKTCGDTGCSPAVSAKIHRDLGVVYIGGMSKVAEGKAEFAAAMKADPNVQLDKDLTTPDIQKAWDEVKKKGAKAAEPEEEEEEPKPKPKKKKPAVAEGDLIHSPPAEQAVLTPVPIFVELPEDVEAAKVQVRYKPFGTTEWKTLDLKKMAGGFGGEIPCTDIGDTTGDLSYYVQAVDAGGDVVGTSGSRAQPNKVPIRNELKGEPPHLPNKPPPAQCQSSADCPPGLPGCVSTKKHGKRGNKGWGASCEETKECQEGLECKNGECATAEAGPGAPAEEAKACESAADCDGGACVEGKCEGGTAKKNWVSFSLQQDLAMIGGSDVCSYDSQQKNGYACFKSDGSQYYGSPVQGAADAIANGIAPATTRILAGFDRLFGQNLTVGARVGFAFRGGPAQDSVNSSTGEISKGTGAKFLPAHLELRAAYWFGQSPLSKKGVRPYAFAGGGMAQVDAKVAVQVREEEPQSSPNCGNAPPVDGDGNIIDYFSCQANPPTQTLDAWKRMGQGFVTAGGGVMYALTPKSGFVGELKLMVLFPTSGFVIAPNVGYVVGF